ncbi:MAG: hypothetical protein A3F91_15200 [Flavobacteria bacterium RIFCSPLOWO2_12_FULL_35_11]|nr:MAG: hypothetical protein A3F91_15200 [Flavobacteria bacterium RIFCSPLOWO2_12_FULL_35_11]
MEKPTNTKVTPKNFIGKIIRDCSDNYSLSRINKREVGEQVYVHLMDDGDVLIFAPSEKKRGVLDAILSLEEAKKYVTCISTTDFDVKSAWDKTMSDRYW